MMKLQLVVSFWILVLLLSSSEQDSVGDFSASCPVLDIFVRYRSSFQNVQNEVRTVENILS